MPRQLVRTEIKEKRKELQTICVEQGMFSLRIELPEGTLYLPTPGKVALIRQNER